MRVPLCMTLLALLGCSDLPTGGTEPPEPADAADPCATGPVNVGRDTAADVILGEARPGIVCRGKRSWFRVPGTFGHNSRFRVRVTWDRGRDAEDADIAAGASNGDGSWVDGREVAGDCQQPAGQGEDCTITINRPDGVNAIYVIAYPNDDAEVFRFETFQLTVDQLPTLDAGQ